MFIILQLVVIVLCFLFLFTLFRLIVVLHVHPVILIFPAVVTVFVPVLFVQSAKFLAYSIFIVYMLNYLV